MSDVLTIPPTGGSQSDIRRIVDVLDSGGVCALPAETGYLLCSSPLRAEGVAELATLCPSERWMLCLLDSESAEDLVAPADWLPSIARLTRRCWPGPLVLEFPADLAKTRLEAWPEETRRPLAAAGRVRFSCSAQALLREVGREAPWPLLAADATHEAPEARFESVEDIRQRCGDQVRLLVDSGAPRYPERSTAVRVQAGGCELIEEGIIGQRTIHQLSSEIVLFVCTGNTCRSPMAEALFRKMLAEHLHCEEEELPGRGYLVLSAGLATTPGMPASEYAVELLRQSGIDLTGHHSQSATAELLNVADHVITMTRSHRDSIGSRFPDLLPRVRLLAEGQDVSDPFGGGRDDYVRCRDEIQKHLERLLQQLTS